MSLNHTPEEPIDAQLTDEVSVKIPAAEEKITGSIDAAITVRTTDAAGTDIATIPLRDWIAPTPEEMERVRELARRFGRDEAEDQRLIALGRRTEELLASEEPPEGLRNAIIDGELGNPEPPAWSWLRERLLGGEPPAENRRIRKSMDHLGLGGSLPTGGINPAEEAGYAETERAARQRRDAPIPLVPFEEDDDGA